MTLAEHVAQRLDGLFPPGDPRVGWLPEEPSAAEAHLRPDARCDLVVGYTGERFGEIEEFVQRCLAHAAERGGADHRTAWNQWINVAGLDVLDAGAQLAPDLERLQVYLRGHFSPRNVLDAFAAVGCEASERLVRNTLALFSVAEVEMIGLELSAERISPAVYITMFNHSRTAAAAIDDAVGFLLSALLRETPAADQWRAIAPELLMTPGEEWVYVSYEPRYDARWVKFDVSRRPLALAGALGRTLDIDVEPMMSTAESRGFDPLAHLGVRFGESAPAVSIYHSLL